MSTNDDAKRPSAVELLRPAVRAMPGYTPGEQISDLVKLNTNEGAFPPSPRVMAALRAIEDETLRLYPDPVSARLRAAAAIVVVDEAYIDFALGTGIDASMLPYLGQHPNLVVLRTMSKSYSMAGARLGLLFAAAPLVAELVKVKDSYNVNAVTQALGV